MQAVFDNIEDMQYVKERFFDLRKVLRNNKTYLIDEIWPKPALAKVFDTAENADLKKLKDILRDERLLRILQINSATDEVLIHLANPHKYRPTINIGGPKISLQKLQS
jgi:hypothetical protein